MCKYWFLPISDYHPLRGHVGKNYFGCPSPKSMNGQGMHLVDLTIPLSADLTMIGLAFRSGYMSAQAAPGLCNGGPSFAHRAYSSVA